MFKRLAETQSKLRVSAAGKQCQLTPKIYFGSSGSNSLVRILKPQLPQDNLPRCQPIDGNPKPIRAEFMDCYSQLVCSEELNPYPIWKLGSQIAKSHFRLKMKRFLVWIDLVIYPSTGWLLAHFKFNVLQIWSIEKSISFLQSVKSTVLIEWAKLWRKNISSRAPVATTTTMTTMTSRLTNEASLKVLFKVFKSQIGSLIFHENNQCCQHWAGSHFKSAYSYQSYSLER